MIVIPKLAIGYQEVPKVATTSLFGWFYDCLKRTGKLNSDGVEPGKNYIRRHFKADGINAETVADEALDETITANTFRFVITRDPIKRFLSMYTNRVIAHRKLSVKLRGADAIRNAGLSLDPQVNELVDKLEAYRAVSGDIAHHSAPMSEFLADDLSVYSHIADLGEIDTTVEAIKDWWREQGLEVLADDAPPVGRKQTGGPKLGLEVLERDAFEKLLAFYRHDYETIPTVDIDRIRDEYEEAVSSQPRPEPYAFPPVTPFRQARRNARGRNPVCTSSTLKVIQGRGDTPILYSRVDLLAKEAEPSGYNGLKGVVVLQPRIIDKHWRVVVADGHGEHEALWGIASPQMAERFPASRQAANSRFLVEGLRVDSDKALQIFLVKEDGSRYLIGRLRPREAAC